MTDNTQGKLSKISCKCGEITCDFSNQNTNDDKLYFCDQKECKDIVYCEECIEYYHKKKKNGTYKKGHKLQWNKTTCLNDLKGVCYIYI